MCSILNDDKRENEHAAINLLLRRELAELHTRIENYKNEQRNATNRFGKTRREFLDLKSDMIEIKGDNEDLIEDNKSLNGLKDSVSKLTKKRTKAKLRFSKKVTDLTAQIEKLKRDKEDYAVSVKEIETLHYATIKEMELSHNESMDELIAEVAKLREDNAKLKADLVNPEKMIKVKELHGLDVSNKKLMERRDYWKEECRILNVKLERLDDACSSHISKIKDFKSEVKVLKSDLISAGKDNTTEFRKVVNMTNRYNVSQTQVADLKQSKRELITKMKRLETTRIKTDRSYKDLNEKLSSSERLLKNSKQLAEVRTKEILSLKAEMEKLKVRSSGPKVHFSQTEKAKVEKAKRALRAKVRYNYSINLSTKDRLYKQIDNLTTIEEINKKANNLKINTDC